MSSTFNRTRSAIRRISTFTPTQNNIHHNNGRRKLVWISAVCGCTAVAGYVTYTNSRSPPSAGTRPIVFEYPEEVRLPLKQALFLKHRYPLNSSDTDLASSKNNATTIGEDRTKIARDIRAGYQEAISNLRKSIHAGTVTDRHQLTYLLVEYGDWLMSLPADIADVGSADLGGNGGAVGVYKEALRIELQVEPGSALPDILHAKQLRLLSDTPSLVESSSSNSNNINSNEKSNNEEERSLVISSGVAVKLSRAFTRIRDPQSAETTLTWSLNILLSTCIRTPGHLKQIREDPYVVCSETGGGRREMVCAVLVELAEGYKAMRRVGDALSAYEAVMKLSTPPPYNLQDKNQNQRENENDDDGGYVGLIKETVGCIISRNLGDRRDALRRAFCMNSLAELLLLSANQNNGDNYNNGMDERERVKRAGELLDAAQKLIQPVYLSRFFFSSNKSDSDGFEIDVKELHDAIQQDIISLHSYKS